MEAITTRIVPGNGVCTLINVFTVAPERQAELVKLLEEATEEVMRHLPGFISANLHRSLDGTRVTNYAQWASREHFEAMLRNPKAQVHMRAAAALVEQYEPHLYEVASTHARA
ncbi:MAG TPA: antibiotic biosynthesis monooxygenase family protein [Archangium sp.]|uniref:antibiotic biosynthesis monooxygenase family protein n=1 Tax=Archangium sp. TaxID=1872627 RepID=UPI002E32EF28|nr:antibiotic biosynthesis monooxygenase family protein [Archangium sp.]HEX5752559.1 antibiotic biosynthesis monooxygenase family protein [Archangium sp.]